MKILWLNCYKWPQKHTLKKNQGSERKKTKTKRECSQSSQYTDLPEILRNKSGLRADTGLNKSTTTPTARPSRANIAFVPLF